MSEPTELEEPQSVKLPDLLYHYTDQVGLLGILEKKAIWATHVRYLNDATEWIRGLEIYRQCIEEAVDKGEVERTVHLLYPNIRESLVLEASQALRTFLQQLTDPLDDVHCFVTSFCEPRVNKFNSNEWVGDDLSQWRGYSGGSGGFAIGFDPSIFVRRIGSMGGSPDGGPLFGACIYDENIQRSAYKEIVSELLKLEVDFELKVSQELSDESEHLETYSSEKLRIIGKLVATIARTKDSGFESEREWRLVRLQTKEHTSVSFRNGKSSIIPYLPIPLTHEIEELSIIKRVVVGPSPRARDTEQALKMLFQNRRGCEGIEVLRSMVPYRDW